MSVFELPHISWIRRPGIPKVGSIVAAGIVAATIIISQVPGGGGTPPPGTGNIWVDTNGGTCARQSSLSAYVDSAACGPNLNSAYAIAQPGDTIRVKPGSYGSSTINFRSGMAASRVNIFPDAGATPTFTDVAWKASYVNMVGPFTFRTLDLGDFSGSGNQRITDLTFDGIIVDHQDSSTPSRRAMMISATDNVIVRNFDMGNTMAGLTVGEDSNIVQTFGGPTVYNTNLTFENGRFHDNDTPSVTSAHNECFYAVNVAPLTIRNNKFESCTFYGIFLTDFNDPGIPETGDNLTIEGNVFRQGKTEDGSPYVWAIAFHPQVDQTPVTNAVIQYNTIENGVALGFTGTPVGLTLRGNIIAKGVWADDASSAQCRTGVTFTKNEMPTNCGATNTTRTEAQIRADWVNVNTTWGSSEDFHLNSGAFAIGAGDTASFPSTDLDGLARTSPPDAGAYKFIGGGGGGIPVNSVVPSVAGTANQGQTLSTSNGTWTNSPSSFVYQWQRCNSGGASCADIGSAISSTYLVVAGDVGSTLRSQVTASNGSGSSLPAVSAVTGVVGTGGGGGGGVANIWVSAGGGTCAGGRSSTQISLAAAASPDRICGDFNSAWTAMNAGDTARITAGSYGFQDIIGNKTSTTFMIADGDGSNVVVTGDDDCGVPAFGNDAAFCIDGNNAWLENFTIILDTEPNPYGNVRIHGTNTTFKNMYLRGAPWRSGEFIGSSLGIDVSGFHWDGGSLGRTDVEETTTCTNGAIEPFWFQNGGNNAIIENISIGRYNAITGAGSFCGADNVPHIETIRFESMSNVVFRNNVFNGPSDAGSGHIFTSSTPSNITFINNVFENRGLGNSSFTFGGTPSNFNWYYNTFLDPGGASNSINGALVGNFGYQPYCGTTNVKNVYQGSGSCGTSTFFGAASFGVGSDNKLQAGSPAIDAAETPSASDSCTDSATVNSLDFEGTARPQGAVCDAGADER